MNVIDSVISANLDSVIQRLIKREKFAYEEKGWIKGYSFLTVLYYLLNFSLYSAAYVLAKSIISLYQPRERQRNAKHRYLEALHSISERSLSRTVITLYWWNRRRFSYAIVDSDKGKHAIAALEKLAEVEEIDTKEASAMLKLVIITLIPLLVYIHIPAISVGLKTNPAITKPFKPQANKEFTMSSEQIDSKNIDQAILDDNASMDEAFERIQNYKNNSIITDKEAKRFIIAVFFKKSAADIRSTIDIADKKYPELFAS